MWIRSEFFASGMLYADAVICYFPIISDRREEQEKWNSIQKKMS